MPAVIIALLIPILIGVAYLIFWLVMLMDAVKKNHLVWVVVILLLHVIGPVLYLLTEFHQDAPPPAKPVKAIAAKTAPKRPSKKSKPAPKKRRSK